MILAESLRSDASDLANPTAVVAFPYPIATHASSTLLCVDDEPRVLALLRQLFEGHGYKVLTAATGGAALEILQGQHVDVILSDVRMAGSDGVDFLERAREDWPDVVRLLLTAHTEVATTINAVNRGEIFRCVAKPWLDDELLTAVRHAIERSELERERRRLEILNAQQLTEICALKATLKATITTRNDEKEPADLVHASDVNASLHGTSLSEERLKALELADVAADWYWEHDVESRVTFLSPSIRDAIGVDPKNVIGKSRAELRGTEPLNCTWDQYNAIIDARKPYREIEYRRTNDQGEDIYYAVSGVPVFDAQGDFTGYRGVGRNITPRRRAELANEKSAEAQRQAAQLLDNIVDNIPTSVQLKSVHDGLKVVMWNKAAEAIYGVPRELAIGKTLHDYWSKEDADRMYAADVELVEAGGSREYPDRVTCTKDRGNIHVYLRKVVLSDASGKATHLLIISDDITARIAADTEVQRANAELSALNAKLSQTQAQLLQSEKLASIGQLAAGVAHEINNPIGYIFSNFQTLEKYMESLFAMLSAYQAAEPTQSSPETSAELAALRERIELDYLKEDIPVLMAESKEGITRVKKIVQGLKDFSRVDENQDWQLADIHHCIDSTLKIVNNEIKYKADVVKKYGSIPQVECLPSQINQVILNLLVNAAHAIGKERGRITVGTGSDDEHVWFTVTDTGCGISKETQSRIFDPFFTTKPIGQGTGLGLSLCYGIVQEHLGRIEVDSTIGSGTTFKVTLPIRHPAIDAAAIPSINPGVT